MTELAYASAWIAALVMSWHPIGAVVWAGLTAAPFVLAGRP